MLKQIYRIKVPVKYLENKKFEKKMLHTKIVRFQQMHPIHRSIFSILSPSVKELSKSTSTF